MASALINIIKPIILNIGGSDSAGMAGIQMDLKVQTAFNVHSLFALTATTAQNNQKVISINPVSSEVLKQQLEAINLYPICLVKVGLVCNIQQAQVIADFVTTKNIPLILDPVLASSSNFSFFDNQNLTKLTQLLLPLSYLITPNLIEASLLTGLPVDNFLQMKKAAKKLMDLGAENILLKGGHLISKNAQEFSQDYFLGEKRAFWLSSKRQATLNTRGTGCALASSITSSLALGYSIEDAVVIGKMAINQGLRNAYSVAGDKGPILIKKFPDEQLDLPRLSRSPKIDLNINDFAECNQPQLGLYPVVNRAHWIKKLTAAGVSTIQLRVKDLLGKALENEIQLAITLAQETGCRLFINDYWKLAIKHNAYGVHLGQEDLDTADLKAIQKAGLRLGLSSHCFYEVARAITLKPSYIAFGPVFHTESKNMPWVPQGSVGLSYWRKIITAPLVAIGGINLKNIDKVIDTGVDSVAMISAITEAAQPDVMVKDLMLKF